MKVASSVKPMCQHCQVILRAKGRGRKGGRRLIIICKNNPRHKQRQG